MWFLHYWTTPCFLTAGLPAALSATLEPLPWGENRQALCQCGESANVPKNLLGRPWVTNQSRRAMECTNWTVLLATCKCIQCTPPLLTGPSNLLPLFAEWGVCPLLLRILQQPSLCQWWTGRPQRRSAVLFLLWGERAHRCPLYGTHTLTWWWTLWYLISTELSPIAQHARPPTGQFSSEASAEDLQVSSSINGKYFLFAH